MTSQDQVDYDLDLFGQVVKRKTYRTKMKAVSSQEVAAYKGEEFSLTRIARGMLKVAILDLKGEVLLDEDDDGKVDMFGQVSVHSSSKEAIQMDALCWIYGIKSTELFSFTNCCEFVDCSPEVMRRMVGNSSHRQIRSLFRRLRFLLSMEEYLEAVEKVDDYVGLH